MYEIIFACHMQTTNMLMVLNFTILSDVSGKLLRISHVSGNSITLVHKNLWHKRKLTLLKKFLVENPKINHKSLSLDPIMSQCISSKHFSLVPLDIVALKIVCKIYKLLHFSLWHSIWSFTSLSVKIMYSALTLKHPQF